MQAVGVLTTGRWWNGEHKRKIQDGCHVRGRSSDFRASGTASPTDDILFCMQGFYKKFKHELRIHILSLLFGRSYSPMCSIGIIKSLNSEFTNKFLMKMECIGWNA